MCGNMFQKDGFVIPMICTKPWQHEGEHGEDEPQINESFDGFVNRVVQDRQKQTSAAVEILDSKLRDQADPDVWKAWTIAREMIR